MVPLWKFPDVKLDLMVEFRVNHGGVTESHPLAQAVNDH